MHWVCSNSLVVVSVIAEHGSEVANDVDDEEDGTLFGSHSEVASLGITIDWMALGSGLEEIIDLAGGSEVFVGGICHKREHQQNDEDYDLLMKSASVRKLDLQFISS